MGGVTKPGFTILETMLFLAITGVLVVSLLAGAGASINTQRYNDSVTALQSNIQQLYSNATDVSNDRSSSLTCTSDGSELTFTGGPSVPVGQSDCVLIGQYMTIVGGNITTSSVVGYSPSSTTPGYGSDIATLQTYQLSVIPGSTVNSQIDWGASIAWPASLNNVPFKNLPTPRTIAILVARSPISGLSYTFTSNSIPTSLKDIIVASNATPAIGDTTTSGQASQRLCINSNGLFNGGLAVVINQDASQPNDIQIRSNNMQDALSC